ncbi:MAG: hypothetical protein KC731_28015, partial [Myxococcales bacterium]|nr:hypothetical protein [Myxococcales bacterium]
RVNNLRSSSRLFRAALRPVLGFMHARREIFTKTLRAVSGDGFFEVDARTGARRRIEVAGVEEDGHCAVSPSGRHMLYDTYPSEQRMQQLGIIHLDQDRLQPLLQLVSPEQYVGSYRCDLHARWKPDESAVCFDATHDGTRQLYVQRLREESSD